MVKTLKIYVVFKIGPERDLIYHDLLIELW